MWEGKADYFCVLEKVPEGNAGGADGFRCQDSEVWNDDLTALLAQNIAAKKHLKLAQSFAHKTK